MGSISIKFSTSLYLLTLITTQSVLANDDLIGHWNITSSAFRSTPSTARYDITIEKDTNGFTAWSYNGPMEIEINGNDFEIIVDWVAGTDVTNRSKLIGTLKNKNEINGRVDHEGLISFDGRPLLNGNFKGARATDLDINRIIEDIPPDPIDLSGLWRGAGGKGGFRKDNYALTEKGLGIRNSFKEMDAPHIRCAGYGMAMATRLGSLYGVEIFQNEEQITLVIGADYVRRIYLDDREYPENREDTYMGFSKGEWKGDTLVVKTTHLSPNFLHAGHGNPISGNAHVIEHFFLDDEGYLRLDMWIHDKENYTRPPYFRVVWDKVFSAAVVTYSGCDGYSYYRQLHMEGELDEFFGRSEYRR